MSGEALTQKRNRHGSEIRRRTVMRAVRLLPEEMRELEIAAKAAGVSAGQYMREAALNKAWETGK